MKRKTDRLSIGVSLLMLAALVAFTIWKPAETTAALDAARIGVSEILGLYFLLLVIACIVFCGWAAFSKYGCIRLGCEKPEYKTFAWVTMLFCAAMGSSILYWSAIEWSYYIQQPPFGYAPLSVEAAEISVAYSFFHWGIPPWCVYGVGAVPLAYRYYMRKKPDLSLQAACEGVLGEKRVNGWMGRLINVVFVFGILGGLTISYGTGIPMLANNLHNLLGTSESFSACIVLIVAVTAVFALGSCIGLKRGIQIISRSAAYSSILLCLLFLVLGYPLFALENSFQSLGMMLYKFIPMLTNLDTVTGGTFARDWTVFYWAWWVCLAPSMWVFIARISRGRSIRAVMGAVVLAGAAGSMLFFGTISNYGLKAWLEGALNVMESMGNVDANQLISTLSLSLPLGRLVLALWFITAFFLLSSTMGSAGYALSTATSLGLGMYESPPRRLRLFWSVMLAAAPLCLLYAGQFTGGVSLGGLKAALILAAVPASVTVIFAMISGVKWLREDFGQMSRAEIKAAYI